MRVSSTKIAKMFLVVFIFYHVWFGNGIRSSNFILYSTVIGATAFVLLDTISRRRLMDIDLEILWMYLFFGLYSFVSGLLVATDYHVFFDSMVTYFAFFMVYYDIYYISKIEGTMDWIVNALMGATLLCGFQALFFGVRYAGAGHRITLSDNNNPNLLGFSFLVGIFLLIYRKREIGKWFMLRLSMVLLFMYVTVRTGSRKSLIAEGILFIFWIIAYIADRKSTKMDLKTFISFVVLALLVVVVFKYLISEFVDTEMFDRLSNMEGAAEGRWSMYQEAFELWKGHPIFGVGYEQFRVLSSFGTYSHSTYAEILANNGLVGILLFFVPVARLGIDIVKGAFGKGSHRLRYDYQALLIMCIAELFMGLGAIWHVESTHLLLILFIAWRTRSLDRGDDERRGAEEVVDV